MGIVKFYNNQWGIHRYNERKLIDIDLSDIDRNNIVVVTQGMRMYTMA